MSDQKMYEDLVAAQAEFEVIHFDKVSMAYNKQGSKYASLGAIYKAILPALNKHGFCLSQPWESRENGDVMLSTELLHKSGQKIKLASSMIIRGAKDEQKFAGCFTYQRRYQVASGLCLFAEEDEDGNDAVLPQATLPKNPPEEPKKESSPARLNQQQIKKIIDLIGEDHDLMDETLRIGEVKSLDQLQAYRYDGLLKHLNKKLSQKKPPQESQE